MAALAIGSVAMAIVGTLLSNMIEQFQTTNDRLDAEAMANRAQTLLQNVFSQAVDVQDTNAGTIPAVINGGAPTPQPGQILSFGVNDNFSFKQISDTPAAWTTLAVFQREGNGGDPGKLTKVGVFYRRPEATNPNTMGMIFVVQSNDAGNPMTPSTAPGLTYSSEYIDRVTLLEMTKHRHPNFDKVVSLDVHVQVRYQMGASVGLSWCPEADITAATGSCKNTVGRKNIDRYFTILLRNNLVHPVTTNMASTAVSSEERVLGDLYFFQASIPPGQ